MHKVYTKALRTIASVWTTTQNAAVYRETGFPPIQQLIQAQQRSFATRIRSLDPTHPVARRVDNTDLSADLPTRLYRTSTLTPRTTRPAVLPAYPAAKLALRDKDTAAQEFNDWFNLLPKDDTVVFSDGSMINEGIGYSYAIYRNQKLVT
jgi:hypothetical protein